MPQNFTPEAVLFFPEKFIYFELMPLRQLHYQ